MFSSSAAFLRFLRISFRPGVWVNDIVTGSIVLKGLPVDRSGIIAPVFITSTDFSGTVTLFLPAAAIPDIADSMTTKKRILVIISPAITASSILRKVFIFLYVELSDQIIKKTGIFKAMNHMI